EGHIGECLSTWTRYESNQSTLGRLQDGGRLFLVTVRPGERLWLVARYHDPRRVRGVWTSTTMNRQRIVDITDGRGRLKFITGRGISTVRGRLAQSLQSPRVLTAEDLQILRGAAAKPSRPEEFTLSAREGGEVLAEIVRRKRDPALVGVVLARDG